MVTVIREGDHTSETENQYSLPATKALVILPSMNLLAPELRPSPPLWVDTKVSYGAE